MTSYRDQPKEHWQSAIEEIEKKCYTKEESKDLYTRGMLTNGQLFLVKGAMNAKGKEEWVVATWMNNKFIFAHYSLNDKRLETLKMKGVAYLLDVVARGWLDTKQAPWLPSRIQQISNPDNIIHGARSGQGLEQVLGDGTGKKVIKKQDQIVSEMEDVVAE